MTPDLIRNKWLKNAAYIWATPAERAECIRRAKFWHRVYMRSCFYRPPGPCPQLSRRQAR